MPAGGWEARAEAEPRSRPSLTSAALNFGRAYPDHAFTAIIWGDRRAEFGRPEKPAGSTVWVTVSIVLYRGKPEVVLQNGDQLRTTSRIAAH